jgi:hypothetical protein
MADQSQPQTGGLSIPADVAEKFGPILELIKASESMNNEERQYWINILPIMTADQIKNLEDILRNEKDQLAAIDAKYSKEIGAVANAATVSQTGDRIRSRKQEREQKEQADEPTEQQKEEELLKQIQSM